MKIYKTQKEVEKDIKDGVLIIQGDVKFECPISIDASIKVIAGNIDAWNIKAWDINACDINARNIKAWKIKAWDINARDINAGGINARNIIYYAFCCVYKSIKCFSWKAKREKYQEPICLDGQLEIKTKENEEDKEVLKAIKLLEYKGKLKDGKILTN
jgi:hypothetical protein